MQRKDLVVGDTYAVTPGRGDWGSVVNDLDLGSPSVQLRQLAGVWNAIRPMTLTARPAGSAPLTVTARDGVSQDVAAKEIVAPFDELMGELHVRRLQLAKQFGGSTADAEFLCQLDMLKMRETFDDRLWATACGLTVSNQYNPTRRANIAYVAMTCPPVSMPHAVAALLADTYAEQAAWLTRAGELGMRAPVFTDLMDGALPDVTVSHNTIGGVTPGHVERVLTRLEEVAA